MAFSLINILGLTLGLSISLLILLFVINELTYDSYHKDGDQIYRINSKLKAMGQEMQIASTASPLGPYLVEHYPAVLLSARISNPDFLIFEINDNEIEEEVYYADPALFEIFTIPIIQGDPIATLKEPFSLAISESMAEKFFGNEDPMNKVLVANNNHNYIVKCIFEDWPENSHIKYRMFSAFDCIDMLHMPGPPTSSWLGLNYSNYIKLAKDYPPEKMDEEFVKIIQKYLASDPMIQQMNVEAAFFLQPLKRIHLYSDLDGESEPGGSVTTILLYSAIGLFILLIACINFMNLSTARSANRLREIGIRKVVGAYRRQLIWQFLTESILISFISLILAVTLAEILLPEFNLLVRKNLVINYLEQWWLSLGFIMLALVVGLIAGSYPALFLSKFRPILILSGKFKLGSGSAFFRNFLVVFQFVISIILISSTGIVYKQLNFVRNADLGFNSEQLLVIPLRGDIIEQSPEIFSEMLKTIPEISGISFASGYPGAGHMQTMFRFEGFEDEDGEIMQFYEIDPEYIDLLGMKITDGRNFERGNSEDDRTIIINETLAKKLGWEDPLGKTITMMDIENDQPVERDFTLVGIIKDFHFRTLHNVIEPCAFVTGGRETNYALAKIEVEKADKIVEKIGEIYSGIDNSWPFESIFMETRYERHYRDEQRQGKIFLYFTILAIFIASLGLFGLASFTAEQRTKEIGIRKVLGSSVGSIVSKLTVNFIKLVLIAAVIAIPVSWYLMDKWLQAFAYKIDMSWWIFALSIFVALLIAFITILYQSLKAANANPVEAISYE